MLNLQDTDQTGTREGFHVLPCHQTTPTQARSAGARREWEPAGLAGAKAESHLPHQPRANLSILHASGAFFCLRSSHLSDCEQLRGGAHHAGSVSPPSPCCCCLLAARVFLVLADTCSRFCPVSIRRHLPIRLAHHFTLPLGIPCQQIRSAGRLFLSSRGFWMKN